MDKPIVPVNQIATRSLTCYEFSNPNPAEVVEIEDDPVETVERQMEDLKLNHQFNEKDVPKIFKNLINGKLGNMEKVLLYFEDQYFSIVFDKIQIRLVKKESDWIISYESTGETIRTDDPEKSIVNHLWFVLKNPNIKITILMIWAWEDPKSELNNQNPQKMDIEKLNTLLQSMINSIDHQIHTKILGCQGYNEDTFLSMLKHVKPGTLDTIRFSISWKEEGNHQKMREIIEMDQWKQAKNIDCFGFVPLKIEQFFPYERFCLQFDSVTPKKVLLVTEHFFNSSESKDCVLSSRNKNVDIVAIIDFLRSQNYRAEKTKTDPTNSKEKFRYNIVKSGKFISLFGHDTCVIFHIN